jgi:hypothetical protein
MAWDSYHGRHRIVVDKPMRYNDRSGSTLCATVNLLRKGSQWKNPIGRVCQNADGTYDDGKTLKKHKRPNGAIATIVKHQRSWIGVTTKMDGARRKKRRKRR